MRMVVSGYGNLIMVMLWSLKTIEKKKKNMGIVATSYEDSLRGDIMLFNALEKWDNVEIVETSYGNSLKCGFMLLNIF